MMRDVFVVPPPEAPVSGGNRYNEGLLAALGASVERWDLAALEDAFTRPSTCFADVLSGERCVVWVDSLYFDQLLALRARLPAEVALRLIAHSLPSQLHEASGAGPLGSSCLARERATLDVLAGALAPSETMRGWLRARGARCPVWVVPPAVDAAPNTRDDAAPLRALMIANLVSNKGVLEFLGALAAGLCASPVPAAFSLRIVGSPQADPAYAAACHALQAQQPALRASVQLLGALPFARLRDELGAAHALVSASRSESFGMALADARAAGLIVLARRGGHVAQLLQGHEGGALVDDDASLAAALLALARADSAAREQRLHRARATRLRARSWAEVAHAFRALALGAPGPGAAAGVP
jgi:glycosyltransferase involved in cell wall biosynthesis